jgi:regulator of replication initiation timing
MALDDLVLCECGHARHRHRSYVTGCGDCRCDQFAVPFEPDAFPDCCSADHARARAPWTCKCKCHETNADQPTAAALTRTGNLYDEAIAELVDRNNELNAELDRLRARYAECVADASQMSGRIEEMGDELERLEAIEAIAQRIVDDAFTTTTVRRQVMAVYWLDPKELAALRTLLDRKKED